MRRFFVFLGLMWLLLVWVAEWKVLSCGVILTEGIIGFLAGTVIRCRLDAGGLNRPQRAVIERSSLEGGLFIAFVCLWDSFWNGVTWQVVSEWTPMSRYIVVALVLGVLCGFVRSVSSPLETVHSR